MTCVLAFTLAACGSSQPGPRSDSSLSVADASADAARPGDGPRSRDGDGLVDVRRFEAGKDGALNDSRQVDRPPNQPDAAKVDGKTSTGLTVPCQNGSGYTLFRFHYWGSGHSPILDVWDATCSYSYSPSSACNIYAVYPGFGSVSYTSEGYPVLTTSEYLRVRFSVSGLSFSKATLYIQARSYDTTASTYYEAWSPIYGGQMGGPVDNDWTYDWYSLDWSNYLSPGDDPLLTAIQLYAGQGSGSLAVKAVELCVQ